MKSVQRSFVLTLFLCLVSIQMLSQEYTLKGEVVNQDVQSVEFIYASLLKDNELIHQTLTDNLGMFSFKVEQGDYSLILEQFGKEYFNESITLNKNLDLGNIQIEESITLEGVMVTARKKLVEQKVDRTIFNVENSIASQGMSGLDALRNTPLVRVQNGNVSIVGKGGVSIMINDRMLNLPGSEIANYLQSLRSDDIARIEVITTPPSRYEAEGNSGIINIILKKNPNLGWSGNLSSGYQRNSYNGFRTGATINYQSKKLSSSLKLRQYHFLYKIEESNNLISSNNSIYSDETRKDQSKALGLNYSLDYKINEAQNIGFIYDFNSSKYHMDTDGISQYKSQTVIDSTLTTKQKQNWETPTHTLNVYYDIKLDTTGKKLSFTGNYLSNIPDIGSDFNTVNNTNLYESVVRNTSKMEYSIYSGQADLALPYGWADVEVGAKYTLLDNNSNVAYYNLIGPDYVINPDNTNVFQYKEHNYASYLSLQKDFNEKWSAKAGVRYEYTSLEGETPELYTDKFSSSYGQLFPTAYISYEPNYNHAFSLNYSKRINRPDFQDLNPFRWYSNPYIYNSGSPTLKPSFNDNVEFTYTYKGKLTARLYNQYSKDNLSNISRLEDGINSNVVENSFDQNTIGFGLSYYKTFFNVWESSLSTVGSYTITTPTTPEVERLKVYSFAYAINNTITLNKDETWFLLVNFWHNLPSTTANRKMKGIVEFTPGVRASFLGKKLNVSAVFSDLFKTLNIDTYANNNGFSSESYSYNDSRKFNFSVSYSFGNKKVKGANKYIDFEEQDRAN